MDDVDREANLGGVGADGAHQPVDNRCQASRPGGGGEPHRATEGEWRELQDRPPWRRHARVVAVPCKGVDRERAALAVDGLTPWIWVLFHALIMALGDATTS